jgi:hypothetical protein
MNHLTEAEIQELNEDSRNALIRVITQLLGFQPPFMRQFTEYAVG